MEDEQLPSSIEEVEALIRQLYGVGVVGEVGKIQTILHRLQLSPQGWQLANTLLNRKEEHVMFFGALTIIVKLNTDAKSLSESDTQSLLVALIGFLIKWIESGGSPLVGRKLCSALVTFFLKFPSLWSNCVKHLLCCFSSNMAVPYNAVDKTLESNVPSYNLSNKKVQVVFWFASALVEDISKMDSSSMKANDFHRYVRPNIDDIVPLIAKYLLDDSGEVTIEVKQAALSCFQSWVSFSHRSFIDKEADLEALQLLTQLALQCITNNKLYEITVEIFTDILSSYSRFLKKENFDSLHDLFKTQWAQKMYEALVEGDYEWNSLQFGHLLLAMGDAIQKELTHNINDPLSAHYLTLFLGLLNCKGYAFVEDKIYLSALEFWSTFVEIIVDESFGTETGSPPEWFKVAQRYVMQAIEFCWRKSLFPPAEEFNSWDSAEKISFYDARRDLSDLIQQFYIVSGPTLLQFWIEKIIYPAVARNWVELEASLYFLAQLGEVISETESRDIVLDQVFTSDLLNLFTDPYLEIPTRTRRSFLNAIIRYANYFGKRPALLPNVLNLSFVILESKSLANQASRSIMRLCSNCRNILLPNLDKFLQHYSNIAQSNTLDSDAKELVLEGITCLIQALDNDVSKIAPLNQLLSYIEADVEKCLNLITSNSQITGIDNIPAVITENEAKAVDYGILILKSLSGIAKGFKAPDDQSINLDSGDDRLSSIWYKEEGIFVQQKIYRIMCQVYDVFRNRGEIVEECCLVLRHGFRELEPGPFILPPRLVAEFMMKSDLKTSRLGLVIKTASNLTSSKYIFQQQEVLGPLLGWVTGLLQSLGDPSEDSEISQAGIEFMHRLLPRHVSVLLSHNPSSLEFLFMFALKAIQGPEPFPKIAAAEFWSEYISLQSQPNDIQLSLDSALKFLGPLLAQALIFSIGGNAARSELEKLSIPLRKLTTCHVNAKIWIEAALFSPNFPSNIVDDKEKAVFLEKIIKLRGSRTTNQVVKDFWLACRGSHFAYAS